MRRIALLMILAGCTGSPQTPVDAPVDVPITLDAPDACAGAGREKIKFTRDESCGNDGSVEWCIPDNDAQLQATLANISPSIHCAPGGGRAGCYQPAGLLLCSYPTDYPDQCLSDHGEMKPAVWDDMCEIAGLPQVTEIVHTIFE